MIAFVADVHIGNPKSMGGSVKRGINKRGELVLAALHWAVQKAGHERRCTDFIACGDLFDSAHPEPQLIRATQVLFEDARALGMDAAVLLGNHEMNSDAMGDNSLAPLLPTVDVVDTPQLLQDDDVSLLLVPFRPGPAKEWLPRVVAQAAKDFKHPRRILVIHLGIQDGSTPPWLQGAHDSIRLEELREVMKAHGIQHAFAGNWHEPKLWPGEQTVCQVGCLAPTGWNNPGLGYGTMAFLHTRAEGPFKAGEVELVRVPGPRFVSTVKEVGEALKSGNKPYLRLSHDPVGQAAAEQAASDLRQAGVQVELIPDAAEAQVAMKQASGMAREATTVDGALAAYIEQMPLEEPELRPEVLARVRSFMAGAGS